MNIFVLCTGRCGSTTFIRACDHITNYSSAHESRAGYLGESRLAYPKNHIEADNRLAWFLGRLERAFGNEAFYIHLTRDPVDVAESHARRYSEGIIRSYRNHILQGWPEHEDPMKVSLDYCHTVNSNIEYFLRDKERKMNVALETAKDDFAKFWKAIGAEGDLDAALTAWDVPYNKSTPDQTPADGTHLHKRAGFKLQRIIMKFPEFIRKA